MAVGYVRSADNRLEMDPDKRVREAIHLVFRKFAEFGSVRQVVLWLKDEGIAVPIVVYGAEGRMIDSNTGHGGEHADTHDEGRSLFVRPK